MARWRSPATAVGLDGSRGDGTVQGARRRLGPAATALAVTVLVALAGCTADPPPPVPGPTATTTTAAPLPATPGDPARTLVVEVDDLGPGFNPHRVADLTPVSTAVADLVLPSAFRPQGVGTTAASTAGDEPAPQPTSWQLDPSLLVSAEVTSTAPFTVTYTVRREAQWSDGAPIAAEDFRYLWEQMTSQPGVVDPAGYGLVRDVASSDGGKTVTVTFASAYPAWRELFTGLLPSHLLKDSPGGFASALDDGLPVSGARFGVMRVDRDRGEVELVRNDRFWDAPASPDTILLRRTTSTTALAASLRSGNTQASLVHGGAATVAQLGLVPGTRTLPVVQASTLGVVASTTSATLSDPVVRAGVLGVLDPDVLRTVGSGGVDAAPAARAQVRAPAAFGYTPTAPDRPSASAAVASLVAAGYRSVDGALTRGGAPLAVVVGADEADPVAVTLAQAAADQLTAAGIVASAATTPSATLLGEDLTAGRVDLVVTRAASGRDPATALASRFGCPTTTAAGTPTTTGTAAGSTAATTTPAPTTTATPSQVTASRGANLSGVCLPALQPAIEAALRGDADPAAVLAEAEPLLWDAHVWLPLYEDRTVFSVRSDVTGVDLGSGLVAGPLSSAPSWLRVVS
ncbi:ABC transporter family substrate-binding protein [Rhodococcus aerolatus]